MNDAQKKLKQSLEYYNKIIITAIGFIILGAVFYHYVENLKWLDSLYFTVITLSTVGYGDIVPHTDAGKLFTIFYIIVGITIFIALARVLLAKVVSRHLDRADRRNNKK